MRRRLIPVAVALLLLAGITSIVWKISDWPPLGLILKYGLPPAGGPTGRTQVIEGIEFVELSPGYFRMGSDYLAEGRDWIGELSAMFGLPWGRQPEASKEMPVHWVQFPRAYWIATTEITNAQYEAFAPEHGRCEHSEGDDDPVVNVTWAEANEFCLWLAARSGRPARLPSEAEWECVCRAGSLDEFTFGDDEAALVRYAWFGQDWNHGVRAVASKRPNRWGIHDLHGNVWEWCGDTFHAGYENAPSDGLPRSDVGPHWGNRPLRLARGGSFGDRAGICRSACRRAFSPMRRTWNIGFRPAFAAPED